MVGYKNISWVKENEDEMDVLKINWFVDLGMGITFAVSFITGLLKFSVLWQLPGISDVILPGALISNLHDGCGILLGCFVFLHLFMNRRWIISTTRKMLHRTEP
jgi:hypothetical protein